MILAVGGLPGSGKTFVSRIISEMGYPLISMGDVVRDIAQKHSIRPDVAAVKVRLEMGMRFLGRATALRLPRGGMVVVDGVRSIEEVEQLEETDRVVLIYVVAPRSVRYERLALRGRSDDPNTISEFLMREYRELRFGVADLISRADYILVNHGKGTDELRRELEAIVRAVQDGDQHRFDA